MTRSCAIGSRRNARQMRPPRRPRPTPAPLPNSMAMNPGGFLDRRLGEIRSHLVALSDVAPRLPEELASARARLMLEARKSGGVACPFADRRLPRFRFPGRTAAAPPACGSPTLDHRHIPGDGERSAARSRDPSRLRDQPGPRLRHRQRRRLPAVRMAAVPARDRARLSPGDLDFAHGARLRPLRARPRRRALSPGPARHDFRLVLVSPDRPRDRLARRRLG